jgi:FixJ family two-component response regulator
MDQQFRQQQAQELALLELLTTLTPREHQVMLGVVAGKLNKQIASELGTFERTIKVHRARAMEKLGVTSVADLVRVNERAGASARTK